MNLTPRLTALALLALSLIPGQASAQAAPAAAPAGGDLGNLIIMFGVIFVLFYFIILRPQKQEQNTVDKMRSSLKDGDKVKTIGGAYGTVVSVDQNNKTVKLEFEKGNRIKFDRAAIAAIIKEGKDHKESE
jgi:preprotein translocase subunit YajC